MNKAIEIILKLQTKNIPTTFIPEKIEKDYTFIQLFAITLFLFLVAIFSPITTIGFGKRKRKFEVYKKWIKIVTVTIPIIIVAKIFEIFWHYFHL